MIKERLRVQVLARHPHDPRAFTQGLVYDGGLLFEGTGLERESSLRRVDLTTGEVAQSAELEPQLFGEGLAAVGDELIQLTWQNGVALVWDRETFALKRTLRYDGEGWGLCFDGERLVMSDGSDRLTFRDPATFAVLGTLAVHEDGNPLPALNELECVGRQVYANVWGSERIVRIDGATGRVTATIDASGLLSAAEQGSVDVLNGIAYLGEGGRFLITGKLWPWTYEVEWVPLP